MQFRLVFSIPFWAMNEDSDYQTFKVKVEGDDAAVELEVKERKNPQKPKSNWECRATCHHSPGRKAQEIFDALAAGTIDPKAEWEEKFGLRDGYILLGPPVYREVVDAMHRRLADLARRCVSLIQWRESMRGSHRPLRGGRVLGWSLDGEAWHKAPCIEGLCGDFYRLGNPQEHQHAQITRWLEEGKSEPMGHELLREALELRKNDAYRAAFVVAVMAAEVGVKQCIMELLPVTSPLLADLQSPPLRHLLEKLLPLIPAKNLIGGKVLLPAGFAEKIGKANQIRNDLVHKGFHPKYEERLDDRAIEC